MTEDSDLCAGQRLLLDQACLRIVNHAWRLLKVSNVSAECHGCKPQPMVDLQTGFSKTFVMSTVYSTVMKFDLGSRTFTDVYDFGQHGHYTIDVPFVGNATFSVDSPADNVYAPLWYVLASISVASLLWIVMLRILPMACVAGFLRPSPHVVIRDVAEEDLGGPLSRQMSGDTLPMIPTSVHDTAKEVNRTSSLDVFRGITVTLMMFVNYGGGKYSIFEHSAWNGLTFADVVFPWFAWIMGVSLALSVQSQLRNAVSRTKVFFRILLRSLMLIALGIVLNSFKNNNIHHLRIPGVLQRLGLALMIVGSMEAYLMTPQNLITVLLGRWRLVSDAIYGWKQWVFMISIVVLHTCIVLFVKIDGCPRGYLGPGGLDMQGRYANCTGGVTGYVDRVVFGPNHIYQHPTSSNVYRTSVPFDPEGLLATLTTAFNVFLGVVAGRIIMVYSSSKERNARWISFALLCAVVTFVLTSFSVDGGIIPINKNLWSLSFVLSTSSLAFGFFAILYTNVDEKRYWSGSPFKQVGRNAIFLYIGHIITKNACPWNWSPIDHTSHHQVLWMNAWSTFLWVFIAIIMDRCNVYITI